MVTRGVTSNVRLCLIVALASAGVYCQTATGAHPTFEVASVKPQVWDGQGSVGVFVRGNTLYAEHASLNDLVEFAYNLRDVQLSGGPGWALRGKLAESVLFQIAAKAPQSDSPPTTDEFRRMLQTLLAERFRLQVHHVSKDLPVYDLVVNRGGPKMKESAADAAFAMNISGDGKTAIRIVAGAVTISQLVGQLSHYAGRPVLDRTGLSGGYDFTLEWMPDDLATGADAGALGRATLFTALPQRLGLRLEAATAPFDAVVVDRAEKPSGN